MTSGDRPLREPSPQRVAASNLTASTRALEARCGRTFPDCASLHHYSVADAASFWTSAWDLCGIVGERGDVAATGLTAHGGAIIQRRSDATLDPGGVRIGTAEIYRQVGQLAEVLEGVPVGQQWQGDERVVLFVRLRDVPDLQL